MISDRTDVVAASLATLVGSVVWLLGLRSKATRPEAAAPHPRRRPGAMPEHARDRASFSARGSAPTSARGSAPTCGRPIADPSRLGPTPRYPAWCPTVTVDRSDEGRVVVRTELPGVGVDEVAVEVYDDGIVVMGHWTRSAAAGSFCRTVALPRHADPNDITATFENEVLTLSAPLTRDQSGDVDASMAAGDDVARGAASSAPWKGGS